MQDPIRWFVNLLSGQRIELDHDPGHHFTRAGRHSLVKNINRFRKRRAKNKVATKSRRINRKQRSSK